MSPSWCSLSHGLQLVHVTQSHAAEAAAKAGPSGRARAGVGCTCQPAASTTTLPAHLLMVIDLGVALPKHLGIGAHLQEAVWAASKATGEVRIRGGWG